MRVEGAVQCLTGNIVVFDLIITINTNNLIHIPSHALHPQIYDDINGFCYRLLLRRKGDTGNHILQVLERLDSGIIFCHKKNHKLDSLV